MGVPCSRSCRLGSFLESGGAAGLLSGDMKELIPILPLLLNATQGGQAGIRCFANSIPAQDGFGASREARASVGGLASERFAAGELKGNGEFLFLFFYSIYSFCVY
jgi:hypothetical protein